jgi:hypothetical protein
MKPTADVMVAWQRLLLSSVADISYRLSGTTPTPVWLRDLAETLESLAARIRREINEQD